MSKHGIRAGHFGSNWALHLDRAFQRTKGDISMNDFARKPARQQAVRLSPLSAFIRRVCYARAKETLHEHDVCLVLTVSMLTAVIRMSCSAFTTLRMTARQPQKSNT